MIPSSERFLHGGDDVVDRALEGVSVALLGRERAKLAGENAEVRVIDVAIQDVGRHVAVLLLADRAGHDSERVEIVGTIQLKRFGLRDALPAIDLLSDGLKVGWNER